jgi:hypothetical protein
MERERTELQITQKTETLAERSQMKGTNKLKQRMET